MTVPRELPEVLIPDGWELRVVRDESDGRGKYLQAVMASDPRVTR